jgi:hypothetical protein
VTLCIDNRGGSRDLYRHIPPDIPKFMPKGSDGHYDGDFELLGWGPGDVPIAVGGEYKKLTESLTAMNDGRIYGTQIARMLQSYQRVYLIIEARLREADDGLLEYYAGKERGKEKWFAAYGREGKGWLAREFYSRIESIEEFLGVRVRYAEDVRAAARAVGHIYRYWTKLYSEHRSWAQWDQSHTGRNPGNILIPTSDLPLTVRWARELGNVGQLKAHYVGAYFGPNPGPMVLAGHEDWAKVSWQERFKTGPNKGKLREKHFSPESIGKILAEIWGQS